MDAVGRMVMDLWRNAPVGLTVRAVNLHIEPARIRSAEGYFDVTLTGEQVDSLSTLIPLQSIADKYSSQESEAE